jgi:hypothetical protein
VARRKRGDGCTPRQDKGDKEDPLGFGYESSSIVVVVVASFTREALAGSREKLSSIRRVTRGNWGSEYGVTRIAG